MPTNEAQVRAYLDPEEPNYTAAAALGAEALPVLERLVQSADPLLASKAAYLAALIPSERAARVLEQAAQSDHPTVRVAAAAGLQRLPEADDRLASRLTADPDAGVRKVAAKASRSRKAPTSPEGGSGSPDAKPAAGGPQAGARLIEGEHGGGYSPSLVDEAQPAAGEGGGDAGAGAARGVAATGEAEESGGGGDAGSSASSTHGGGQF